MTARSSDFACWAASCLDNYRARPSPGGGDVCTRAIIIFRIVVSIVARHIIGRYVLFFLATIVFVLAIIARA